jgi:hypothetical protein
VEGLVAIPYVLYVAWTGLMCCLQQVHLAPAGEPAGRCGGGRRKVGRVHVPRSSAVTSSVLALW